MIWQYNPYALPLLIGAALMAGLAYGVWRRKAGPAVNWLVVLMVSAVGVLLSYSLELSVADTAASLTAVKLKFTLYTVMPVIWLLFIRGYLGHNTWLNDWRAAALMAIPSVQVIAIWTNPFHQLYWITVPVDSGDSMVVNRTYGPAFWLGTAHLYGLLLVAAGLLVRGMIQSANPRQRRLGLLLAMMGVPWAASALTIANADMVSRLDLVLFSLALLGLPAGWVWLGTRFLDTIPAARDVIFRGMADGVIVVNAQGQVVDINPAADEMLGLRRDKVLSQPIERVFRIGGELIQRLGADREITDEFMLINGDTRRDFDVRVSALRSRQGRSAGWVIAVRDIGERKRAEERLRKLSRAVEQSPSIVMITDSRGQIEYVNPKFTEITGYTPDEVLGQNPRILSSGEKSAAEYGELWASIKAGGEWRGEFHNRKKNGELYWESASIAGITNPRGEITHFISVKEDITARKEAEETARGYASELEQRNGELDAFSYTIAHDLKVPLNAVAGFADLLANFEGENLSPSARKYVEHIVTSAAKMETMINELLLLARLRDVGEAIVPVAMTPVAQSALHRFEADIHERGIEVEIMPDMPPAMGHAVWLEEVFANLVGNAIKYIGEKNPAPRICIAGMVAGKAMRYEVRDNGLGIAPKDQEKLFDLFARFHVGEATGLGLGLAIVLRIVSRLEGQVGVDSLPGQGSTFWFTLPAVKGEHGLNHGHN